VNGGPAVPFPSKEAEEQMTEVVKKHLEDSGVISPDEVVKRSPVGDHVLVEYRDGKVSLDGGPKVSKDDMKTAINAAEIVKERPELLSAIEQIAEDRAEAARKHVREIQQLDLEMKPAQVRVDEEEMETVTYRKFDLGKFKAKIREDKIEETFGDEALMNMVRGKVKVATKSVVNDGEWDAACHALHTRLNGER